MNPAGNRGVQPTRRSVLLMAIAFEGGLVVLWLVLGRFFALPTTSELHLTGRVFAMGTLGTLPLLPLMWWCSRSQMAPLRNLMREVDETLLPFLSRLTVSDLALVATLAGIGEEGVFRGIIQSGLSRSFSPLSALMASSWLFGLVHLVTPAYAALAALISLYLGYLYHATGNIAVPIIIHALYDFAALVYLLRVRRRKSQGGSELSS